MKHACKKFWYILLNTKVYCSFDSLRVVLLALLILAADIESNVGPTCMPNNTSQHQFKFFPLSYDAQLNICWLLELPLVYATVKTTPKNFNMPTQIYKMVGDGKCLFRALAYSVCGTQNCYKTIRNKFTLCMYYYELEVHPHIGCSVKEYLEKRKIRTNKVWGTDIEWLELLVAAWLFKCDVFVY